MCTLDYAGDYNSDGKQLKNLKKREELLACHAALYRFLLKVYELGVLKRFTELLDE